MNLNELNSQKLLLEKALEPLLASELEELKRIEKLAVNGFTEADVRAEIIDPIVRILGYRKGLAYSVDREKHLRFLGKTSRYIDYNLTLWEKNFWLIEAKKPISAKSEFGYDELSQAVEYATHPEIDAALVVLCDGIKLEVFDREQNVEEPLLRFVLSEISNHIEDLRKLLCPVQIWFFYRRRVIKAIDRAFEREGNQNRVNEFKQIVETRLNEKRAQILENFRNMNLLKDNSYHDHLSVASIDEIIDIHFFIPQPRQSIAAMTSNLLADCKKRSSFHTIYKMFPDGPRDVNESFYMHALDFLINFDADKLQANWYPSWLVGEERSSTQRAIQQLVQYCLTHFIDDEPRKTVLLAANSYRRIYKILAVLLPHQKNIAEAQHLLTRYAYPEFSWEQILSSRERNIVIGFDNLSLQATTRFVQKHSKENLKFNLNLAKQELATMWKFESSILDNTPNYIQLVRECDFGEIHPTEASGVVYDDLGHSCLCIVKEYPDWRDYVMQKHHIEVEALAGIGSWAARELLGEDIRESSKYPIPDQLLADRFFFGDLNLFKKIANSYGYKK